MKPIKKIFAYRVRWQFLRYIGTRVWDRVWNQVGDLIINQIKEQIKDQVAINLYNKP